jgi:glutathione peroxidase
MSIFNKLIRAIYPVRMNLSRRTGMGITIRENTGRVPAPESFYALHATLNSGEEISFEQFRNKKVLIVNLASQCGFTPQYGELESLHQKNRNLAVLGFPANNFGAQEPGTDQEIAGFCTLNYGVTFPFFKKEDVKGNTIQPVYGWLSRPDQNGWNDLEPEWNFYKYLVDEKGNLRGVFSSAVSPFDIQL